MGNLKQFFIRADYLTLAVRQGEEHLEKGGVGEKEHGLYIPPGCPSPAGFNSQKNQAPRWVPGERPLWMDSFLRVPEQGPSVHSQTEPFPGKPERDPREPPWSVVIATWWITEEIGFLQTSTYMWLFVASALWQWIVLLTERILICSATPHFSTRSSLTILMRVFFQETHISLFDLGASVRIFFNTTLAF